jgi:lipopolysaccharide export system ATP-binding protein
MHSLDAKNIRKSYAEKVVLEDVSLSVDRGQIVGLLGPNGAGKTTCFYILVGLIKADSGAISLGTAQLTDAAVHKRAQAGIGYLPQEASVFKNLSTQDNILAILELNDTLNPERKKLRLEELIDEFNLGPVRQNLGQSLSGGERRRLEIARALASDPQFILLDEPFAGVDPISVNDIKDEIIDLARRGIGVLITDHNVKDTLDICDRAYIVHQGHIIAEGQPEEILSNKIVQKVYLGDQFGT